jgi:CSLREA domain-containing protein
MATINGTTGNNNLMGTSSSDVINGKAGDDYIDGKGGADIIDAGAGNDTVVYDSADKLVLGGSGFDTLLVLGANQVINMNVLSNPVLLGFEMVDIRGSGANTLNVSALGILLETNIEKNSATNSYSTLIVRAGQDDVVNKGLGWTDSSVMLNGVLYHGYNQSFVKLLVEDRPAIARVDNYSIKEDAPLTTYSSVLTNDSDADGDSMSVQLISGPSHAGSFTLNANGTFSYMAATNYNGDDSFSYRVTSFGVSTSGSVATAAIHIGSVNDAPMGADNAVSMLQGSSFVFHSADFGFSDPNDTPANTLLAVKIDALPSAGVLTNNGVAVSANQFVSAADIAAGHLQFTPAANGSGNAYANFTFQVQDNGGVLNSGVDLDQSANTITLNVTPVVTGSLVVTTLNDTVDANDGVTSLREAVDYANTLSGAQSITFATGLNGGTITLTGGELHITESNLTIDASNLVSKITISGNDASRVFNLSDNTTSTLNLDNLQLVHGSAATADGGGAILLGVHDTLNIDSSVFQFNLTLGNGGAIAGASSLVPADLNTINITNSNFAGNGAVLGGAIFNFGSLTINGSSFLGNTAVTSAGAILDSGTLSIGNSTFTGNIVSAADGGGGAIVYSGDALSVDHTTFQSNISTAVSNGVVNYGGAIFITDHVGSQNQNIDITNSSFLNNNASNAGAIAAGLGVDLSVDHSTFTGNTSYVSGGAIYIQGGGTSDVSNSTFTQNAAGGGGGAILNINAGGSFVSTNNVYNANGLMVDPNLHITFQTIQGGAIYSYGGTESIGDTFTGNVVRGISSVPDLGHQGGAIYNSGTLVIIGATMTENKDTGFLVLPGDDPALVSSGGGGAIYNSLTGVATISESLLSANTALSPGGAIQNLGVLSISDSTLANNIASGFSAGGAIWTSNNLAFVDNTLSNNKVLFLNQSPDSLGNGVYVAGGTFVSYGTIYNADNVANPGGVVSGQYNMFTDSTTGTFLTGSTNIQNSNLLLGVLQDNGGNTLSIAPLPTSPVLNQVNIAILQAAIDGNVSLTADQKTFFDNGLFVDQIGGVRSGIIDLGAIELTTIHQGSSLAANIVPASNVIVTGTPSYQITGGADAAKFNLSFAGGLEQLNFNAGNVPTASDVGKLYDVDVSIYNSDSSVAELTHFLIGILA